MFNDMDRLREYEEYERKIQEELDAKNKAKNISSLLFQSEYSRGASTVSHNDYSSSISHNFRRE